MVATLVVVCRALPFGIYAFIWGYYPVGGSRLERGGGGCHSGKYMERSDIPPPSGEEGG